MAIVVESFNGTDIQTSTYRSFLMAGEGVEDRAISPVVQRPSGRNGRFLRSDVVARTVPVHVEIISGDTDSGQIVLAQTFAPGTTGELVVTYNGTSRGLTARVERTVKYDKAPRMFTAILVAEDPLWHSASQNTNTQQQTSSGTTWTRSNAGNAAEYSPVITFQPKTTKLTANAYLYKREVIIANRVARPFANYAVDVTNGGIDHAAIVTAVKAQADGDDWRVRVDGVEVPRWFGEHANNDANSTATKTWINLTLSPAKTASLLAAITNVSPANNGDLEVVKGGTSGWPTSGALLVDDEVITYTGTTENNSNGRAAFTGITRGARNTTAAAHDAADVCYWIERRVQIIYGYSGASAPDARNELKPMLDLTSSTLTNTRHEWINFAHATDPRSMQWTRAYESVKDDQASSIVAPSGSPAADMQLQYYAGGAQAGKPTANIWERDFPSGVATSASALNYTRTIGKYMGLQVLGHDTDGNEAILDTRVGEATSTSTNVTPASNIYSVRFWGFNAILWAPPRRPGASATTAGEITTTQTDYAQKFFVGDAPVQLHGIVFAASDDATPRLVTVVVYAGGASSPGTAISALTGTVTTTALGATDHSATFTTATSLSAGAAYWVTFKAAASNEVDVYQAPPEHGTDDYNRVAAVTDTTPEFCIDMVLLGTRAPHVSSITRIDNNLVPTDGAAVSIDGVNVDLESTGVPYFAVKGEESIYWLNGVFGNNTTSQTITFDLICAIDDQIKVDVGARTVTNITTNENVLYGAKFSDPDEWIRLAPGTNTFVHTETGLVRVDVTVAHYDRWH